jgi:hypothetical protein
MQQLPTTLGAAAASTIELVTHVKAGMTHPTHAWLHQPLLGYPLRRSYSRYQQHSVLTHLVLQAGLCCLLLDLAVSQTLLGEMSVLTHSRKMQQCSYAILRGAPNHNAPGAAGRRLFAAAGSRRVTDGVCAICAGGVQGFIPALLLPFAGGGVPTAAAAAPCVPALLGVLLRWAAASTAPATAPSSP